MKYMFNGRKYVTKGIDETLPPEIQLFLFSCIDAMCIKTDGNLDYLQVFTLETVKNDDILLLHIHQKQEIPEGSIEYILSIDTEIHCKVFLIDDIEIVTMLLA